MSLWGTKKKDDDDNLPAERSHPASGRDFDEDDGRMREEATERDRLLPSDHRRPPHSDGYLDPDDPAVSVAMLNAMSAGLGWAGFAIRWLC